MSADHTLSVIARGSAPSAPIWPDGARASSTPCAGGSAWGCIEMSRSPRARVICRTLSHRPSARPCRWRTDGRFRPKDWAPLARLVLEAAYGGRDSFDPKLPIASSAQVDLRDSNTRLAICRDSLVIPTVRRLPHIHRRRFSSIP